MKLSRIRVENFRRLKDVSISLEEDNTIFVGPNNSGKTSAIVIIRSFLEKRDFKIHDFSSSVIALYDAFGEGEEVDVLPCIQLDLWFSVDPEKVSYGQAILLATSISTDFSEIGIRCSLELKSREGLIEDYNATFPEQEEASQRRSLSHFLGLENNLKKHFQVMYSSLENTVSDPTVTPIDQSNGKKY